MLKLDNHITLSQGIIDSPNLCDQFSKDDLVKIGAHVYESYQRDVTSRAKWTKRTEAAMDLAMQIQKDKSFPWQGCSNVAFPLVTIAALQFHARAYPAIVNGRSIVQCRVTGADLDGQMKALADRISEHMSWQLLEQDEAWEEQQDRALINVPIVGTAWKKSYYSGSVGHNVSELVLAKDLVLDYWAKSIDTCPVKTHIVPLYRNDIYERVRRKIFCDILNDSWYTDVATPSTDQTTINADNRAGLDRPQSSEDTPFIGLEQHCSLDLDGDGYAEPYIVTIEETSQTVLRIVTRFERFQDIEFNDDKEIVKINATEYFTKIPFVPSPDGGIMDVGFGVLLGPLNESVNSAINQLFDAGTMANTAGGFLGRGAKIRGGVYSFSPFEWNRVDSTGDDLRKNIYPLPVREPSSVLFNLLTLLIEYTNRISGATDMLTGVNPGQNTPAETARSMVEQGQKVYSAIFKRIWRSLKQEFKKLYNLNAVHMPSNQLFGDGTKKISREDYLGDPGSICPVADPNITSINEQFQQASMIRVASHEVRGYDQDQVERRFLKSLKVDDIDVLYPGIANLPPDPPDIKVQIQQMKMQVQASELELKKLMFITELQEQSKLNSAKIIELLARAEQEEAKGENEDIKLRISAFTAAIQAMQVHNDAISKQIVAMTKEVTDGKTNTTAPAITGTNPGTEGAGADISAMALPPGNSGVPQMGQYSSGGPQGPMG